MEECETIQFWESGGTYPVNNDLKVSPGRQLF